MPEVLKTKQSEYERLRKVYQPIYTLWMVSGASEAQEGFTSNIDFLNWVNTKYKEWKKLNPKEVNINSLVCKLFHKWLHENILTEKKEG